MSALRLAGRVLLVLLVLLACASSVLPAVARAQFAAAGGGGVVDVLGALLGKDVTVQSLVATAASGSTGLGCQFNGCRIDFGAGANDYAVSGGGVITFNASLAVPSGQSITSNILANVSGTTPITLASPGGVVGPIGTLPGTCGAGNFIEGDWKYVAATTGVATKKCVCTKDAAGAFTWLNEFTGAAGTTTTCP